MKKWEQGIWWAWLFMLLFGLMFFLSGGVMGVAFWVEREGLDQAFWLMPALFGGVGLVLMAVGAGMGIQRRRKNRRNAALKADGILLKAQYMGCERSAVMVNDRPLLNMKCMYTDAGGKMMIFTCKGLRQDPAFYLKDGNVNVYCKRDDYSVYFVDIAGSVDPDIVEY